MIHYMKLNAWPFAAITSGQKDIEVRLNDEKRKQIKIGDKIIFTSMVTSAQIEVMVLAIHPFKNFKQLYQAFPATRFGCEGDSVATMVQETYDIYSPEQEAQHGVLGIEITLVKP